MKIFFTSLAKAIFNMRSLAFVAAFLFSTFTMQSCLKKEEFDFNKIAAFNYDPSFAAPLIHSKLTLSDILKDYDSNNLFVEDGTGFLSLVYKSTVFSQRADELISIADQNVNSDFIFAPGPIAFNDSVSAAHNSTYTFTTTANERFDRIHIKEGALNFNLNTNINHRLRINITIPNAKKDGVPFSHTIVCEYSGGPININQSIDLSNYIITFAPGNKIAINYKVTAYGDGNPDHSPYNISMGESFRNLSYHSIFGYLGQRSFTINQDSLFIDIFKNNIWGSIRFEEPKLTIYTRNSYGMPISIRFDKLEAVHPPFVVQLSGSGFKNPWVIEAPTFAQLGQSALSVMPLNNTNSNLSDFLNISPKWLNYYIEASSNPLGDPMTDQNFVLDTSIFSVDVEVELPLHGSAWDFQLQDTLDFKFSQDVDKAEWVKFKINTDNGFPIDAKIQVFFVDSLNKKIDSLLTPFEQVIFAAPVGPPPASRVTANNHKYVETTIYRNRLTALKNARKILIFSKLATINNGTSNVKIYSDYSIDVKIGVQVQGQYQMNLNN